MFGRVENRPKISSFQLLNFFTCVYKFDLFPNVSQNLVLLGDLPLPSLTMKQQTTFTEGG